MADCGIHLKCTCLHLSEALSAPFIAIGEEQALSGQDSSHPKADISNWLGESCPLFLSSDYKTEPRRGSSGTDILITDAYNEIVFNASLLIIYT